MIRVALSILVLAIGLTLVGGGARLAQLGGSRGYIVLGALLALSGGLLLARRGSGLAAYAVALLFALAWGLWEVGLDWWALAPRGGFLVLLGLLLLLPPVVRPLRAGAPVLGRYGVGSLSLSGTVAATAVVAVISMVSRPHEIDGAFSPARMAAEPAPDEAGVEAGEWPAYGRTAAGLRYSPLDQITHDNLDKLEVAWTYHAGDVHPDLPGTALEATPLVVGDTLYLCTPKSELIALDPVTGAQEWRFDPRLIALPPKIATYTTCRGLSYHDASGAGWPVSDAPPPTAEEARALVEASVAQATEQAAGVAQNVVAGTARLGDPNPDVEQHPAAAPGLVRPDCLRRLFLPTRDARLIAVSAQTGVICPGFGGDAGTVNL